MDNWDMIKEAIRIVINYFEACNIFVSTECITNSAIDWYRHSEISDPYMLATMVIQGDKRMTWDEMVELTETLDLYKSF